MTSMDVPYGSCFGPIAKDQQGEGHAFAVVHGDVSLPEYHR